MVAEEKVNRLSRTTLLSEGLDQAGLAAFPWQWANIFLHFRDRQRASAEGGRPELPQSLQPPITLHTSASPGAAHLLFHRPVEHLLECFISDVCHIGRPRARKGLPCAGPS